jgi:hypothetical protein
VIHADIQRYRVGIHYDLQCDRRSLVFIERRLNEHGATTHRRILGEAGWSKWQDAEATYAIDHPFGFVLSNEKWTDLMNQMWEVGLRPTRHVASAGVEDCLKDEVKYLRTKLDELLRERTPRA